MDKEQQIIDLMQTMPRVLPPENFTPRVMAAISEQRKSFWAGAWQCLATSREFTLDPLRAMRQGVSNDELSLYFIMVAFVHLTIAVVLFMGFKKINAASFLPLPLRAQPWLSFFLAGWLVLWGLLLKLHNQAGVKGARFATFIYLEIAVLIGIFSWLEFKGVPALLPFFAINCCISVASAIFLALSCRWENAGSIKLSSLLLGNLHKTSADKRGFTLIEAIVVIIIISILAAYAVSRTNFSTNLQAEADKFKSQLRYVQLCGLSGNNTFAWQINVNPNSYSFTRFDGAGSVNMPLPGATGSASNIVDLPAGITAGWTGTINFDQWGSPGSNPIAIPLTDGSTTVSINVTRNTGFVP